MQNNILFGTPFDEERYKKTLYACALGPDLDGWPKQDLTEVGERGVTLRYVVMSRSVDCSAHYTLPQRRTEGMRPHVGL